MENWKVHWLTAAGDLADWKASISRQITAARKAMAPFVAVQPLDILVERGSEGLIPEIGLRARAGRSSAITLVFDPYNDNFERALAKRAGTRQILRAAHQAMRLAGPGYGFTLGGAMVSEGLAGQFVRLVLNSAPEPWDVAVTDMDCWWPEYRTLMSPKFDHAAWFEGGGDKPRWLGYTLGFKLAENWLTSGAQITPRRMIDIPAPKVLTAALAQEIAS